jgi:hypothetical protein
MSFFDFLPASRAELRETASETELKFRLWRLDLEKSVALLRIDLEALTRRIQALEARENGCSSGVKTSCQAGPFQCSFCGISKHDAQLLIEGSGVYICPTCVDACNDILIEKDLRRPVTADPGNSKNHMEVARAAREARKDALQEAIALCGLDVVVGKEGMHAHLTHLLELLSEELGQ